MVLVGCISTSDAPASAPPTEEEEETEQPAADEETEAEDVRDELIIAIRADDQRTRWTARQPEEYEEIEPPFSLSDDNVIETGETLYLEHECAVCHGWNGRGDGIFSPGMNPRPIDLTDAGLMDRLGDDYLFWRLSEGGLEAPFLSAMPAFKDLLAEEERWQIIAYLRSIVTEEGEVVMVGDVDLQVGINLLQTYGCFACHRYNDQGNFVGPDLEDIGAQYDLDYLHRSIVDPGADIPSGFPDTMPKDYEEIIPADDLDLMLEFLAASTGDIQVAEAQEEEVEAEEEEAEAEEEEAEAEEEEAEAEEEEAEAEEEEAEAEEEEAEEAAPIPTGGLPFTLSGLETTEIDGMSAFLPVNRYNILVNYELGMHCVGFDMSYCCVIPPYNSIQGQAVRSGSTDETTPKLLSPDDNVTLQYGVDDNTYSEGDKMFYWGSAKDTNGDGDLSDPNDNLANYVWTHLYIYEDLEGTIPEGASEEDRLHVGLEIPVQKDHGPSGAAMEGFAVYADEDGGNVVFTRSRFGNLSDIPLVLTASHMWDALGLPLTAFYDGILEGGSHRSIDETHFQPYQYSRMTLYETEEGEPTDPIEVDGEPVSFIGTNPVDIPNCVWCHSSDRANQFGANDYDLYQTEYNYWVDNYPDISDYMARLSASMISILEMHDDKHDTEFLAEYDPNVATNRLGSIGPINCSDCHGDNVQGRLEADDETPEEPLNPLTVSIHTVHLAAVADEDSFGRTQSCQTCHPTHTQFPDRNVSGESYSPINKDGTPRYSDGDIRDSAGCYTSRDAHTNRNAQPPFFLNAVGQYMYENVSIVDGEMRGLYCTNCHNFNSQALYNADTLTTPQNPGDEETLRNKTIEEIAAAITGSDDVEAYANYYLDPKVGGDGNPLVAYYKDHEPAALPEVAEGATYADASAGHDWWLAAGEPHCADCHMAPFVESMGGGYFPIDQQGKYSLYRYSKAHANLACQSCHESIHGLYTVNEDDERKADVTTHEQALQFSPDGEYTGPVTCVACHVVGESGVPVELANTDYADDYWSSVVLMHLMRGEDFELSVEELLEKYPYDNAAEVVEQSTR
jgi:mono/diheme cytochrome c family protein